MVTISDVAKAAGVSKTTVSYVLSSSPRISEETTKKVRKTMRELGYSVNHAARVLSTSETRTLGIVAPNHINGYFSLSMGAYLYSISAYARQNRYDTLLLTDPDGVSALREMSDSHRIDGAILMDVVENDPRIAEVRRSGMPAVLLGKPNETLGLDYVDSNFEASARSLVDVLADSGHEDVLLLGWAASAYERQLTYALRFRRNAQEEARSRGVNLIPVEASDEKLGSAEEIQTALKKYPQATAVIIHNDSVLVSAPQILQEMQIRVPDDISVVAIVPNQMGLGMRIPYTAVNIDLDEVAKTAVDAVIKRIKSPKSDPTEVLVTDQILDRGSVGVLPR